MNYKQKWALANPEKILIARRAYQKKWALANPELSKKRIRQARYKRIYGISIEEVQAMRDRQLGLCAICLTELGAGHSVHIDHDHQTKRVRGILCQPCNHGLGLFRDSIIRLNRAIEYLGKSR